MTSEASPARKALIAVILAVTLFAAVVVQLTVVNRLPLPGAAGPDLVLLLVTAIAVSVSPATAAVAGFAGGLALDVAPPAAHYAGEYALVFCLAGYAAARIVRVIWNVTGERDPVTVFTVMAAAAAAGEAGKAALGMLLSDPDVTAAAASRVLPAAVLYDLLLAPLVYWLVARLTRVAARDTAAERAPAPEFVRGKKPAPVLGQAALGQAVFRQASAGAAPSLRLAGTGGNYASPPPPRRVPRLRLSGTSAPAGRTTSAAGAHGAPLSLAGGRTPELNLAASRPRRATRQIARAPGKNWLGSAASPAIPAAKRAARSPSRGWLTSAGAGGLPRRRAGTGAPGHGLASASFRGASLMGSPRSVVSPAAARPALSPHEALAARSAPSGLSALSGTSAPLSGRRSPQPGWLRSPRPTSALRGRRRSPRRGWLGSAGRPRAVIGSGVAGRGGALRPGRGARGSRAAQGNWYTAAPSGAWLRRSRRPWRERLHLPGAGASRGRKPRLFRLTGGPR